MGKKERKPNKGKMKIEFFVVLISVTLVMSQGTTSTPASTASTTSTPASTASTTKTPASTASTTKGPATTASTTKGPATTASTTKVPNTTSGASSYGAVAISFLFTSFMVKFSA